MAKKKTQIPKYGTITLKGIQYYRTRITDADGKELSLYAATCEELYEKQLEARKQVEEIIFHRQHPTVAEYGEKWLLMQSAKVSASTLRGYTWQTINSQENFVIFWIVKMGNFNKLSEYIVFQMGEISINPLEINEVSVH